MIEKFYQILFDPGQSTCFSETPKGTRVLPVQARTDHAFFTINALDPTVDRNPTETYHAANIPRRADHNVICFRNVLIEMDGGPLAEQLKLMKSAGVPWSTCVSSGGKSLHFIISLKEPLPDRMAYARMVKRIYRALAPKLPLDPANKNPSRFSRCPGAWRGEKSAEQKPIAIYGRVPNITLERWLNRNGGIEASPTDQGKLLFFPQAKRIFASTEMFLRSGAPEGQWNTGLFRAACNLFETGHSLEDAIQRFRAITGTLDARDLSTIQSAFRRAARLESSLL